MSGAPTPSAPQISFDLRRAGRVLALLTEVIGPHLRVTAQWFTDALCQELHDRSVGDTREVVLRALLSRTRAQLETRQEEAGLSLARLAGLPEGTVRSAPALASAYASAKRLAGEQDQELLRDVARMLGDLQEVQEALTSGRLAMAMAAAWDEAEPPTGTGALDRELSDWSLLGLDSERLCWALIVFESSKHIPLVWMVCNRLSGSGSFGDRSAADLFGYGWRGLRVALRHYEPATGFAFSTYGVTRITGEIRDGVRSEHVLPKRLTTYARKIAGAESELVQSLGRSPSLSELAEHMGEDLRRLTELAPRLSPSASLQEMSFDGEESPSWLIEPSLDPSDQVIAAEFSQQVRKALDGLPQDEREAVQLLLLDERSVAEVRQITGATARQLRARLRRGTDRLRTELASLT
jgi:RNA polymerase sigma-B factor